MALPHDLRTHAAHGQQHAREPTPLPTSSYLLSDSLAAWSRDCRPVAGAPACEHAAPSPQRVAVCLTGSARTFVRPHVHRAFASNLVRGLHAATVDVFAVMRAEDVAAKHQASFEHGALNADDDALAAALAAVSPRAVWLDRGDPLEATYGVKHNPDCNVTGFMGESRNHIMRSIAQPASWRQCARLIARAEALDGNRTYDWVIRTRADLLWFYRHPPICALTPRVAYTHHWIDHHDVLPRDLAMDVLGSMVDEYVACTRAKAFPHFKVESWLQAALTTAASGATHSVRCTPPPPPRARTGLSTLVFPAAIVRNHSGESEARLAVRAYCVPYALLGEAIRAAGADGVKGGHVKGESARVPPPAPSCSVTHGAPLQAALATCLRRAYPDEHDTLSTSAFAVSRWWESTAYCNATLLAQLMPSAVDGT